MRKIIALIIAALFIFAGCSSSVSKIKEKDSSKTKINAPAGSNNSSKSLDDKSSKLQDETEKISQEIDKLLDSLEDIDESNFDF